MPVEETDNCWVVPRPRCTASISTCLQPVADRIGPTPEDLGQDPVRRPTPGASASAKWWLGEYGITGRRDLTTRL